MSDRGHLAPGTWPSPFTPAMCASQLTLVDVAWDSDGQTLVWLERRSDRGVLVAQRVGDAACRDLTPELPVRARVGYGGADFAAYGGGVVFASGGRLYRQELSGGAAHALTPAGGEAAAPTPSPDGRHLVYVHSAERRDVLAVVDARGRGWPQILAEGADFYAQPAWHPGGAQLAWISWDHPHMPWDGTTLHLARLDLSGPLPRVAEDRILAGGDEAILQPVFSADGRELLYASDRDGGWWNLYLRDLASGAERALTQESAAEIGGPAWLQGGRGHAFSADGARVYFLRHADGEVRLWQAPRVGGEARPVAGFQAYAVVRQPAVSPTGDRIAAACASNTLPARIVVAGGSSESAAARVLRFSSAELMAQTAYAAAEHVTFPAGDGASVHGILYRPPGAEGAGPLPAVIRVHGGPTGQAVTDCDLEAQFLATRGYAVLDLNYRGSTGYGRAYRDALRGNWGLHDTEDAVAAGRHLADAGVADPRRLVVMGGSAGGYTVLRALTVHPGFFRAGVCLFGVSNLFTLAAETHKLEERYLDGLVGPLPETAAVYRERSPIYAIDRIADPIAVFQGQDDPVVPRSQADTVVESLARRGVPHVYRLYPGEGHGFRKTETIIDFHETLDAFLRQHVVFA